MMATSLEELDVLNAVEVIADDIWKQVTKWNTFERDTVGGQLARAVDSIGANIAESFGRYHFGEKLRFLYYARGSLYETKYWINRCSARGLFPETQAKDYATQLTTIARQLNSFAKSIKTQQQQNKKIREDKVEYVTENTDSLFSNEDLKSLSNL
ncbi:MAG: four helix bundle protein [Chloroflexi bacterium]|nr:four helix bundle protein [Chloroflexota bacterium]